MSSSDTNLAFATALEVAEAVRTRRISAVELIEQTLARIDHYNPQLNAIIWQDPEQALARAKAADKALRNGRHLGSLHGVPVTIKEALAYRGSPNSWGQRALAQANSPRTAIAIERLESAGAIVVGKTNVPVMLADWQTYNPIHGTTNNPWDLTRTPGGSTGGGAAALAAGLGHLTLGSDLAGSIRIPSHFCGVYGHKPSLGLVSMAGMQPGPWDGSPGFPMDLAVIGPMARSARDLALALEVLGGPESDEAIAWAWAMPPARHSRLANYRVGYVPDEAMSPLTSEARSLYENVLSQLGKAGATLVAGWPRGVDPMAHMRTFQYLLFSLLGVDADDHAREAARKRLQCNPDDIGAAATVEPHQHWLMESRERLVYRALWQQYFRAHDVFIMPVTFTPAFPHDQSEPVDNRMVNTAEGPRRYLEIATWISTASVTGLPATTAPIGRTAANLPVGVQILAPLWEDNTSIEFAALLADIVDGFTPPPAYRG